MKKNSIFIAIILGSIITATSQSISTEEIQRQIKRDSAVFSWNQVNEFVNGLENEQRLYDNYQLLKSENESLLKSYEKCETRNLRFADSIVPSLEQRIANLGEIRRSENEISQNTITTLNQEIKVLKKRKWKWFSFGALLGLVSMLVFGG